LVLSIKSKQLYQEINESSLPVFEKRALLKRFFITHAEAVVPAQAAMLSLKDTGTVYEEELQNMYQAVVVVYGGMVKNGM
jgi:hypothetical protein